MQYTLFSRICVDISSNFVSSCPSNVSTKAVSSCGLEMSSGLGFDFVDSVVLPEDVLDGVGVTSMLLEGTFNALKGSEGMVVSW